MNARIFKNKRVVSGVAMLAFILAIGASTATYARSVGGYAGAPLDGLATTCFTESFGGVVGPGIGSCGSSPRWEIPLLVDASGTYTVKFTAHTSSGFPISIGCQAYATDGFGHFVSNSNHQSTASSTFVTLTLTSVTVPSGGNLILACDGMTNGTIGNVNW